MEAREVGCDGSMEANRPDQGPVLKTGGGAGRLWVRVPRLPPRSEARRPGKAGAVPIGRVRSSPGTPTGRAARLKPGRLWVRIPPWVVTLPVVRSVSFAGLLLL